MTEQTQPTDAEILDAADDFRSQYKHGGTTFDEFDALGFARAVLAKWGTPAGAGEVASLVQSAQAFVLDPTSLQKKLHLEAQAWGPLASTTQPAQAQAGFKSGAKSFQTYAEANAYSKGYYAGKKVATKAQAGAVPNWQDISTAPKDGTRFVAVGQNYGLYSETQHTCIAQWFRGCWMEASDWNETSELKYLTHWMPLPPLERAARKQGGTQ